MNKLLAKCVFNKDISWTYTSFNLWINFKLYNNIFFNTNQQSKNIICQLTMKYSFKDNFFQYNL